MPCVRGQEGGVDETGSGKRDHKDFALWKAAKPGEPTWESPWGPGRPGWHIECTAMSLDHFEKEFDIHGGGHDLPFPPSRGRNFPRRVPHPANSPVVHHWLHNGFVNIDGEKMSKSLDNFWTIRDILAQVDAMVLRFALINAHYRSPIDMNEALLNDAERNYNRLLAQHVEALKAQIHPSPVALPQPDVSSPLPLARSLGLLEKMGEGFAVAMDDDFNSREAVAKVLGMVREITKVLNTEMEAADRNAFAHYAVDLLEETAGRVLGVLPPQDVALAEPEEDPRKAEIADEVEALLLQRSEASEQRLGAGRPYSRPTHRTGCGGNRHGQRA